MAKFTTNLKSIVSSTFLIGALALSGCGGGGGDSGQDKGQAAAVNPYVITNDAAQAVTQGQFKSVDGYLSRSNKVLLSAGGAASATFRLGIDKKGYYKAFTWTGQVSPAVQDSAAITIRHGAGETKIAMEQQGHSGQWRLLGVFEFDPLGKNEIELASQNGGALVVDAVRFEYLGREPLRLQFEINTMVGGENAAPALPDAEINKPYSESVVVLGGTRPYRFSIEAGVLPSGLVLDQNLGQISGTATNVSSNPFTLSVTDAAGARITVQIELVVEDASVEVNNPIDIGETKAKPLDGNPVGTPPDLSDLIGVLYRIPEGSWAKVNLNLFSAAWPPAELRTLIGAANPSPRKIIEAWSSFAWDPNRGELWIFGGGHANYTGNDVYRWRGTTRRWERASLASEIKQNDLGYWEAFDGPDRAPASAHTYDNNMFLPIADRMLVWGGAAYNHGGTFVKKASPTATTVRRTGPYMFDPNRADPNKVGGTDGSHVQRVSPHPEILGGNMWQNRDMYVNVAALVSGATATPNWHVSGCTGYAVENGKDVAYVAAGAPQNNLFRYVVNDVNDPTKDTFTKVGGYKLNSPENQPSCAYDPVQKVFFKRNGSNSYPFIYWGLSNPGFANWQVKPIVTDPTGEFDTLLATKNIQMPNCGLDFDPVRRKYGLWCRDGRVWMITPPAVLGAAGWTIEKQTSPSGATPLDTECCGDMGKWKFIPNLDAFMALSNMNEGQIWLYKPVGWTLGGGEPPPPPPPPPPPTPTEVIVDNAAVAVQDVAGGRTFTGTWCGSSGTVPYGTSSLYTCGAGIDGYRWTPNITGAAAYDVYVRWSTHANRSEFVPVSVTSLSGTHMKTFNQKNGGGIWTLHGRYNFEAGTSGYAEVTDINGLAIADAVRFVPVAP